MNTIEKKLFELGAATHNSGDNADRDYTGGGGHGNYYKEAVALAKTLCPVPDSYDNSDDDFYEYFGDELFETLEHFQAGFDSEIVREKNDIERFALEDIRTPV